MTVVLLIGFALLYLLTQYFKECYLFKPETSRQPAGLEIYIVATEYLDILGFWVCLKYQKLLQVTKELLKNIFMNH